MMDKKLRCIVIISDHTLFFEDQKPQWSTDILLCMARERPGQRLMQGTSVFEILEASARLYQIEYHANTLHFYSYLHHSADTFPLKDMKTSEKLVTPSTLNTWVLLVQKNSERDKL